MFIKDTLFKGIGPLFPISLEGRYEHTDLNNNVSLNITININSENQKNSKNEPKKRMVEFLF